MCHKGSKVKEIQELTSTRIKFSRGRSDGAFAIISGDDQALVERARKMMMLGVEHFRASVALSPEPGIGEDWQDVALLDLRAFYNEVSRIKF